jgi:hypothetical protein
MKPIQITRSVGTEDGHLPGHLYHDIDVTIARSNSVCWAVRIRETWGSSQGDDEERGRREVFALGESLVEAVQEASRRGEAAGVAKSYLRQALSSAEARESERVEEDKQAEVAGKSADLSQFSTEQLLAEIRSRGATAES